MIRAEHTTCTQRARPGSRLRGFAMNALRIPIGRPRLSTGPVFSRCDYASATGTVNAKTHPSPGFETTEIVPPWASTIHFEM